jgi:DNA-binding protein HU-beta
MSNRSDLVSTIATSLDITKKLADEVLVTVTSAAQTQLATNGEVVFPGFGRLRVETRQARKGHNPKTGEAIDIPAKQVIKFKPFPGALK